jgi:hypothetical protein
VMRAQLDDAFGPDVVGELVRGLQAADGTTTVLVDALAAASPGLWPRLSEVLDSVAEEGSSLRLVMAGAGDDRPGKPALARRVADDWDISVEAPDALTLVVPAGTLFVPGGTGRRGGWWRFTPGEKPLRLGPRCPAPVWQEALAGVPAKTSEGCVVQQIPAGFLVRPAEATPVRPGDLYHSIPVDPRRPTVVVGVPHGEDVSVTELAGLIGALPEAARTGLRLVPGGLEDLLPLARRVCDLLGVELQVSTGIPLLAGSRPLEPRTAKSVLAAQDGTPMWLPFIDAVLCRPTQEGRPPTAPSVLRWRGPSVGQEQPKDGVIKLSDRWQASVTRAGLWVSARGAVRSGPEPLRVRNDGPAIELGSPGEPLDMTFWPALAALLEALEPAERKRASLHVAGVPADGGSALRRMAVRYSLRSIHHLRPRGQALPAGARRPAETPASSRAVLAELAGAVSPADTRSTATPRQPLPEEQAPLAGPGRAQAAHPVGPLAPTARAGFTAGGDATTAHPHQPGLDQNAVPQPLVSSAGHEGHPSPVALPDPGPEPTPRRRGNSVAPQSPTRREPDPATWPVAGRTSTSVIGPHTVVRPLGQRPKEETPSRPITSAEPAVGGPGIPAADTMREPRQEPAPRSASPATEPPVPSDDDDDDDAAHSLPPTGTARPVETVHRPIRLGRGSTEEERAALRALVGVEWERHAAAVDQELRAFPALSEKQAAAARADLIALRMYLEPADGPFGYRQLRRAMHESDARMHSYAACLVSALHRMPAYRGMVLRGTGPVPPVGLRPGVSIRDPAPVSAVVADPGTVPPGGPHFVVWSVTGRRVARATGNQHAHDEVVFAPGTPVRVLDVRHNRGAPVILLREVPNTELSARRTASDGLDDTDRAVLTRLEEALRARGGATARAGGWPPRCAGGWGAARGRHAAVAPSERGSRPTNGREREQ